MLHLPWVILAGLASAALFYFGTGLHPIWWMVWLAPVPVLAIAPRLGRGAAFLLAAARGSRASSICGVTSLASWQVPLPITLVLFVVPALVFALGVLLVRGFLRRGVLLKAALAFPVFWVSFQYLSEVGSPHSTFGNLAYSQMNCLPLIQIASVTGIWGISFVVLLFAASAAALSSGLGTRRERTVLFATVGVVLAAVFLFGIARLRSEPKGEAVSIALIGKDVPISVYINSDEKVALGLLREYADEIRRAAPAGTQVVVLPEKIVRVSESALPEVDAMFSAAATATHSAIDLGIVRRTASESYNSARFYSAAGNWRRITTSIISSPGSNRKSRAMPGGAEHAIRPMGTADLQGHGLPRAQPRVCGRGREPAARAGVGFQCRPVVARADGDAARGRKWVRARTRRPQWTPDPER